MGPRLKFQESNTIQGWEVSPGSRAQLFSIFEARISKMDREMLSWTSDFFGFVKDSAAPGYSRAVNGAMVEV